MDSSTPHVPEVQQLCIPIFSQKTFYFESSDFPPPRPNLSVLNKSYVCTFDNELLFLKAEANQKPAQVSHEAKKKKSFFKSSQFQSSRVVAELCLPYNFSSTEVSQVEKQDAKVQDSFSCAQVSSVKALELLRRNRPPLAERQ